MNQDEVPGKAVAIAINTHRSEGFVGNSIARVTCPLHWNLLPKKLATVPSHASVMFRLEDGRLVIYEAMEGKGWRGPIDFAKVEAWAAEKPGRWVRTFWIPDALISEREADRKLKLCHERLNVWRYSTIQLPRMGIRKYVNLPMKPTYNDVVCSEAGSIMLAPQVDVPMMCRKPSHDYITPYQLQCAMEALTMPARHGAVSTDDAYALAMAFLAAEAMVGDHVFYS
jgi:hypothetical protein